MQSKLRINIYGCGASALILAHELAEDGRFDIHIFERNKACGRKFLVAGKGGFNLTHDLGSNELRNYYWPLGFMDNFLESFSVSDFRQWLQKIGVETYVGSSGRVFPKKGTKPIEVLQAIMKGLGGPKTNIHYRSELVGFSTAGPIIRYGMKESTPMADIHVYALGGASWAKTGSDGHWASMFRTTGIEVHEFGPSNCGLQVVWTESFKNQYAGTHLKNIETSFMDRGKKGELTITDYGIEGNAVYPISSAVSNTLRVQPHVDIAIDFKIQFTHEQIMEHLLSAHSRGISTGKALKGLKIGSAAVALLRHSSTKEAWNSPEILTSMIKSFRLSVTATRPLDEAISTTGGVARSALTENLEIISMPDHYCIGEMVDWDAPTGGFLLQGCFAMGYYLAEHIKSIS